MKNPDIVIKFIELKSPNRKWLKYWPKFGLKSEIKTFVTCSIYRIQETVIGGI